MTSSTDPEGIGRTEPGASTGLAAFLLARLKEREREERSRYKIRFLDIRCPECFSTSYTDRRDSDEIEFDPCGHTMPNRDFVEKFCDPDPDPFVVADIEAKRQIIDGHPHGGDGYCGGGEYHGTAGCKWLWPCPTLRLLALPYADHPEYRKNWAAG